MTSTRNSVYSSTWMIWPLREHASGSSTSSAREGSGQLNVLRQAGQIVRLLLADPAGTWKQGAPKIEVALGCH